MFTALVVCYFLTWLLVPHILFAKRRPVSTLAWIWGTLLFPFIGPLTYLIFGVDRMTRKRLRKRTHLDFSRRERARQPPEIAKAFETLEHLGFEEQQLIRQIATINEIPPSTADELRLLIDSVAFYPALEERIRTAKHHIHFQFFVYRDDEYGKQMLDALVDAARRGVVVRVLTDAIGSWKTPDEFFAPLLEAGGKIGWFRTLHPWKNRFSLNLRNHRKVQIFDGCIAFVGGMNLGREYAGKDPRIGTWHDAQMEIRGDVVGLLQDQFANDWYFATDEEITDPVFYKRCGQSAQHVAQVVIGGPDLPREPMPKTIISLMHFAKRRVWIATGYFVPDTMLLAALQICAARGVDVRIIVSEKSDHPYLVQIGRSYYEDLLNFGVRIFEYERALHHAKVMVVDGEWLMVGSANCDNRSMRLNFELNVLAHAPDEVAKMQAVFLEDFSASKEIKLDEFRARPFSRRLVEAAYRPLAPLL